MFMLESILLGIIQGIFEFFPVSSAGHLVLFYKLLEVDMPSCLSVATLAHLGSLVAVIRFYTKDVRKITAKLLRTPAGIIENIRIWYHNKMYGDTSRYKWLFHSNYGKLALLVTLGNIPTVIFGLFLGNLAEAVVDSYLAVGIGFLFSAVFLLVSTFLPKGERVPRELHVWEILVVGTCQGGAVFPGVSRFALTLSVFLLLGMTKKAALKCSLFLSMPILLGAFIRKCPGLFADGFSWTLLGSYAAVFVFSAFVSMLIIRWCLNLVLERKMTLFAVYCLLAGIFSIGCHFAIVG
ncbi:MAG TPA: hypothetical protein DF613_17330 [Lachnospiraceae bacterium]|nr:hypothetical protein [Lachnospiraceae bacterium]